MMCLAEGVSEQQKTFMLSEKARKQFRQAAVAANTPVIQVNGRQFRCAHLAADWLAQCFFTSLQVAQYHRGVDPLELHRSVAVFLGGGGVDDVPDSELAEYLFGCLKIRKTLSSDAEKLQLKSQLTEIINTSRQAARQTKQTFLQQAEIDLLLLEELVATETPYLPDVEFYSWYDETEDRNQGDVQHPVPAQNDENTNNTESESQRFKMVSRVYCNADIAAALSRQNKPASKNAVTSFVKSEIANGRIERNGKGPIQVRRDLQEELMLPE